MAVLKQSLSDLQIIDRCDFCHNGLEAVTKATEIYKKSTEVQPYCLVLVDFQMPRLNGIEVIKQIRKLIKKNNEKNTDHWLQEPLYVV